MSAINTATPKAACCSSVGGVASGDVLGEVFGQVADAPAGVLGPGEHALGVELGPKPGHMQRIIMRADRIEGLVQADRTSPVAGSR